MRDLVRCLRHVLQEKKPLSDDDIFLVKMQHNINLTPMRNPENPNRQNFMPMYLLLHDTMLREINQLEGRYGDYKKTAQYYRVKKLCTLLNKLADMRPDLVKSR